MTEIYSDIVPRRIIIVGMQRGDEGKGKITGLLAPFFDIVARFNGGANAGHTVYTNQRHATHYLPGGVFYDNVHAVLGNGMVLHVPGLKQELEGLAKSGVTVGNEHLHISDRIHLIAPYHLDAEKKGKDEQIGTTLKGIWPAYTSKNARIGLRPADLRYAHVPRVREYLLRTIASNLSFFGVDGEPEKILDQMVEHYKYIEPYVTDTSILINKWTDEGKHILFEGAQGKALDINQGMYKYTSSSDTVAGGASTGSGISPKIFTGIIGVVKAYLSQVGISPCVTRMGPKTEELVREEGQEYGTTTGRPRDCAYLDLVALKRANEVNRPDIIAFTKIDVLDKLLKIKLCTKYRLLNKETKEYPGCGEMLYLAEPVYEEIEGWQTSTRGTTKMEELPPNAQKLIKRVEEYLKIPIGIVSTGPRPEETIVDLNMLKSKLHLDFEKPIHEKARGG